MYRSAHGATDPVFRGNRGRGNAKIENMHVKYQPVMIRAMRPVVASKAAMYTRHVGVEALHHFIQPVLSAPVDHGTCVP